MTDQPILGSRAWIVAAHETTQIADFLDATYSDHFGEIWLFNNDLRVIAAEEAFRVLYRDRIVGKLWSQIDAIKVLVRADMEHKVFAASGKKRMVIYEPLLEKLSQIYRGKDGAARVSTFYFGVVRPQDMPPALSTEDVRDDTWIFYTHRGHLDSNGGVVMLRRTHYPFSMKSDSQHFGLSWMLKDQGVLQRRLKMGFEAVFNKQELFGWAKASVDPLFAVELVGGLSEETERRRRRRERAPSTLGLSIGDTVDIAIIAALDVEMEAWEKVLGLNTRDTPLKRDPYSSPPGGAGPAYS